MNSKSVLRPFLIAGLILFFAKIIFAQNSPNARLFYSKPKLYNSKSKVDHLNLSRYDISVDAPVDRREQYYGEPIYKNIKSQSLVEFFETTTVTEIQNKITSDIAKFRRGKHASSAGHLKIKSNLEIFYSKVHGFVRGKSIAKARMEIIATLNDKVLIQNHYESLYVTDGLDKEFEGDVTMTMEQGENVTLGMALRKALDQFYSDLGKVLTLGANKVLLAGMVTSSKNNSAIAAADISFKSDSTHQTASSADGKFEIIVPVTKYRVTVTARDYITLSDVVELHASPTSLVRIEFKLKPAEKGSVVVLKNVLFHMGTTDLMEDSYDELDAMVVFMKSNSKLKIELDGHTDNQGDAKKDLVLSKDRAEKIKQYLVSKGINSRRVSSKGFGGAKPISSNATEEGRKLNRRVEFVILKN